MYLGPGGTCRDPQCAFSSVCGANVAMVPGRILIPVILVCCLIRGLQHEQQRSGCRDNDVLQEIMAFLLRKFGTSWRAGAGM